MRKNLCVLVSLFLLSMPASQALASDDLLSLSAGYYNLIDDGKDAADFRAEYRWGDDLFWGIRPFAGVEGTSDGAIYGLGGFYYDWAVSPHFYITPSLGAGLYHDGDGRDLGHVIEFRSQLEISYEFTSRDRLGLGFSHISNASIGDRNPGTEVLSLYYHMPVSRFTGSGE